MTAIRRYGDDQAIDAVLKRVRSILSRKRKIEVGWGSHNPELVDALLYLRQFQEQDPRIPALFAWITDKRMDYLQAEERAWIDDHLAPGRSQ